MVSSARAGATKVTALYVAATGVEPFFTSTLHRLAHKEPLTTLAFGSGFLNLDALYLALVSEPKCMVQLHLFWTQT